MMIKLLSAVPFVGGIGYMILLGVADWPLLKAVGAVDLAAVVLAMLILHRQRQASPIHLGFAIFVALAVVLVWTGPGLGAPVVAAYPGLFLNGSLLMITVVPPLLGRGYFTYYFSKKGQPEAVWESELFVRINRELNWFWAALFLACGLASLVPGVFGLEAVVWYVIFNAIIPWVLPLGVGLPVTILYPMYAQRRAGLRPGHEHAAQGAPTDGAHLATNCRELIEMMPRGFNPEAAGDLRAVYQFDITGDEKFTAHLAIADGKCQFHDGPAENPGVTVKSPADVWLAVAQGKKDGQTAFMAGEYKIQGDLSLLMKLNTLFQG
jgi:putative sterol carrier protein